MFIRSIFFCLCSMLLIACNSSSSTSTSTSLYTNTNLNKSSKKIPGADEVDVVLLSSIERYDSSSIDMRTWMLNTGFLESVSVLLTRWLFGTYANIAKDTANFNNIAAQLGYNSYFQSHSVETLPDGMYLLEDEASFLAGVNGSQKKKYRAVGVRVSNGSIVDTCTGSNSSSTIIGADPFAEHLWHINNTGQSALAGGGGVAGEDLRISTSTSDTANGGKGILIAIVDDGGEICHPDLIANVVPNGSINFNNNSADTFHVDALAAHGTAMAGVAAAVKNNSIGGHGIAYNAQLKFFNYLVAQSATSFSSALGSSTKANDVDIFNQSFGSGSLSASETNLGSAVYADYQFGITSLRKGLGAIYVKSAGNGFNYCFTNTTLSTVQQHIGCINANVDASNNIPYQMVIGAFNADGKKSSYSSVGSVLWASAPGGEYGSSKPALISTDPQSCAAGRNYKFRAYNGEETDTLCNYTKRANGTSAAAAAASGSMALLLATPATDGSTNSLTWRDIKHIVAKTARKIDDTQDDNINYTLDNTEQSSLVAQYGWLRNSAGYTFHNWYGFGAIDVGAAAAMIKDYTPNSLGAFSSSNWISQSVNKSIPDNNALGLTDTIAVANFDGNIEAVVVRVDITHPLTHDLQIELQSPSGSKSIVHTLYNRTFAADANFADWQLLTNAFYGETLNGNWHIRITDGMGADVGTLNSWALKFYYGQHP